VFFQIDPCAWQRGRSNFLDFGKGAEPFSLDFLGRFQRHRPLDGIFQFAHVAGPVIVPQDLKRPRTDARYVLAHRPVVTRQKMIYQDLQILRALPQRRNVNRDDRDPIVKILPEKSQLDALLQVAVGRRNQTHVD